MSWHAWATGQSRSRKDEDRRRSATILKAMPAWWPGQLRLVRARRPGTRRTPRGRWSSARTPAIPREPVSDLIAFLAALDSVPFLEAFGLPGTDCRVEREELPGKGLRARGPSREGRERTYSATGDHGRRDPVWRPVRTIRLLGKAQAPPARCYLIGLDGGQLDALATGRSR